MMFVLKSKYDALETSHEETLVELKAVKEKLARYTKGLAKGTAASVAKRRAAGLANLHAGAPI